MIKWARLLVAFLGCCCNFGTLLPEDLEVVLVKIGGSSITDKAKLETTNEEALDWFINAIARAIHDDFKSTTAQDDTTCTKRRAFVIVHGAGSFGHFTAKQYGLKGLTYDQPQEQEQPFQLT